MSEPPLADGKNGQARTRLARAAVVQAARTLFLERGYAATTIEAISDLSDVPPATVYRLFSSKLGILKALLDVSIAGDDEAVPLAGPAPRPGAACGPRPQEPAVGFRWHHPRHHVQDRARLPDPRQRGGLRS